MQVTPGKNIWSKWVETRTDPNSSANDGRFCATEVNTGEPRPDTFAATPPFEILATDLELGSGALPTLAKTKFSHRVLPSLANTNFSQTKFGQHQLWPKPQPTLAKPSLASTNFGQNLNQLWPNQVWPTPTLGQAKFGQHQLWPKPQPTLAKPSLASTNFGQNLNQLWPNQVWPTPTLAKTLTNIGQTKFGQTHDPTLGKPSLAKPSLANIIF